MGQIKCQKCGKVLSDTKFYRRQNREFMDICKACLTMHVDNFDPETYTWILKDMDFPYIPNMWIAIANEQYLKNADHLEKFNGQSVLGRYVSKMRLSQHKGCTWADSEELLEKERQKEEEAKQKAEEYKEKLEKDLKKGIINEAQYQGMLPNAELVETKKVEPLLAAGETTKKQSGGPKDAVTLVDENKFFPEEELPDPAADLTKEDKVALAVKWGRVYTPNEWIKLESNYARMCESFDIQDADSENTLLLLCKTHLKMDQAIDMGDLDGYTKLSKTYESLRKSAKFTAAQNKDEKDNFVDSIGQLVAACERDGGFIPRYAPDEPQDKVDAVLLDMNKYTNNLVKNEMGFGQQIEDALERIAIQLIEDEEERRKIESGEIEDPALTNEDMIESYDRIAKEIETDVDNLRVAVEED